VTTDLQLQAASGIADHCLPSDAVSNLSGMAGLSSLNITDDYIVPVAAQAWQA
jgi:hypothetical protein